MARNAWVKMKPEQNRSTRHVLNALFGRKPSNYRVISRHLATFCHFHRTYAFIIICGDGMVKLVSDIFTSIRDQRGAWSDDVHGWERIYDDCFHAIQLANPVVTQLNQKRLP